MIDTSNSLLNPEVFKAFPVIETERLRLRAFSEDDLDDMFAQRNDKEVRKYISKPLDPNKAFTLKMIKGVIQAFKEETGLSWIIENKETRKFMGSFGFWNIALEHGRAEIGYSLNTEYWNQGFMTEVLETCLPFAFDKAGIHSVYACVNPDNIGSNRVLEKTGFKKEAHFREDWHYNGKFFDTVVYGLLKKDLK